MAAVVLAAGAATRFGAPKQRILLPRVLARLAASPVDEVVVVEGAYGLSVDSTQAALRLVHCDDWERGPGASLRCGLAALGRRRRGRDRGPGGRARALAGGGRARVRSWRSEGGDVVAASYAGVRGHPLLVARAAWAGVPDAGLRALDPRLVPCDDLGAPGDVDTPADLTRLDA